MSRFLERLAEGPPLVADGGVGSLVAARVPHARVPEEANLLDPEAVLGVHLDFIRAGAELIETNTFGANRRKLAARLLDDRLAEIVERGVRIAREAREVAGRPVLIAGSIGPLGERGSGVVLESRTDAEELIAEQARLLEGRGVDVIALETFASPIELARAVVAVRSVSALPIVALLSFTEDAETVAGVSAREAAGELGALDLAAVGANCGLGPETALSALAEMAPSVEGPVLAVLPNVGLPTRAGGRIVYPDSSPDYFAEFAARARQLGARIVGGCCGTMPAHIGAIRAALEEERAPRTAIVAVEREPPRGVPAAETRTALAEALAAGRWVVSVELDPPKGASLDGLVEAAAGLRASGLVDVVDVNDSPMARARMSALAASVVIEQRAGIETIPHVTPRDTTAMGLESQLLGAHAQGIRNLLAVTGDPPSVGDYAGSYGVYEIDSIGLVELVSRLNAGEDVNGRSIDAPTSFFTGVAVNPSAADLALEVARFRRKLAAGARFAMTQALFDVAFLDRFLEALGEPSPVPLLVGVWPVRSFQLAYRLHNEVPGIVVPEPVLERLSEAGPNAAAVGLDLARSLAEECRSRAAGIYVIPPFREPEAALELLR
jgi:homocysteine S-methyltransferase